MYSMTNYMFDLIELNSIQICNKSAIITYILNNSSYNHFFILKQ